MVRKTLPYARSSPRFLRRPTSAHFHPAPTKVATLTPIVAKLASLTYVAVYMVDVDRFQHLRPLLKTSAQQKIPGTSVMTYGRVIVI